MSWIRWLCPASVMTATMASRWFWMNVCGEKFSGTYRLLGGTSLDVNCR